MFTKACEYALRATLYVSIKSSKGAKSGITEIANEIDAPRPFTAKIMQTLTREGILSSVKGPNGGFYVDSDAKPVTLEAIVLAIDGSDEVLHDCALGLKQCSDKYPCPIHNEVKAYKTRLRKVMRETTVQMLINELAKGKTYLRNGPIKISKR